MEHMTMELHHTRHQNKGAGEKKKRARERTSIIIIVAN